MKTKTGLMIVIGFATWMTLVSIGLAQVGVKGPQASTSSSSTIEKFTKLDLNGNGPTNFISANCAAAGLVCPSGDTCECVETTGNYKGNIVGSGTFDFIINLDETTFLRQGSGFASYGAAGFLTLTSGSNTLVFETNGIVADTPKFDAAQYTGSYGVSSGTGKFATTIGAGTLAWNSLISTGDTQISLSGNIDQKP